MSRAPRPCQRPTRKLRMTTPRTSCTAACQGALAHALRYRACHRCSGCGHQCGQPGHGNHSALTHTDTVNHALHHDAYAKRNFTRNLTTGSLPLASMMMASGFFLCPLASGWLEFPNVQVARGLEKNCPRANSQASALAALSPPLTPLDSAAAAGVHLTARARR